MGARILGLRVAVALGVLLTGFVCVSGSALAMLTHEYASSFGAFSWVQGVAVDESSGEVYVYDAGTGSVFKFDAEGSPMNFSSTGTNAIEGVGGAGEGEGEIAVDSSAGPAKGDIYVANGSQVEIYSSSGESLGQLTREAGKPWGRPCGVAVDSTGHVFVGLYPTEEDPSSTINQYAPAANPVTNTDYASSLWKVNGVCNVAVGSAGSMYADTLQEGPITRYEALQFSPVEIEETTGTQVAESARALTVDGATDDLYAAQYGQVSQYEASGGLLGSFTGVEGNALGNIHGLAVNSETGRVYVSDNNRARISVFGPTLTVPDVTTGETSNRTTESATLHGTVNPDELQVTNCQFEYGTTPSLEQTAPCAPEPGAGGTPIEVTANIGGLHANTTYYYRLSASNGNGTNTGQTLEVLTYSPPVVTSQWTSAASITTATVNARLRSMGFDTTYRFEYGTDTTYGQSAPATDGSVGIQEGATVSQPLSGLKEGTVYHYRIAATNNQGITDGPDSTFKTLATPAINATEDCPNAAYRTGGLSASLPDCRAYEMVSPLDKNGSDIGGNGSYATHAAIDGKRASFLAGAGFADTAGSGNSGLTDYVASRGDAGWTTHSVTPTPALNGFAVFTTSIYVEGYADDLQHALWYGFQVPNSDPGTGGQNYYRGTSQSRSLETITIPSGTEHLPEYFNLENSATGFSSDVGVVAFESHENFLPQTTGSASKLYEWERGTLSLAGVLPDGTVPSGGSKGLGRAKGIVANEGSVSGDGSRVLFLSPVDGSTPQQLYVRKGGTETAWISRPETSGPAGEPQGVGYQVASRDGRRIVFTSETPLLDVDPGGPGVGLYLYTDSQNPETESNLRFITRAESGGVLAMSDDATHIYYYSEPSFQPSGIYLWDEGAVSFVVKIKAISRTSVRVSGDGERMTFLRAPRLREEPELAKPTTGGDVGEGYTGSGHLALYLYDHSLETITCVSCPRSNVAVSADVEIAPTISVGGYAGGLEFQQRYMSSDGRQIFFTSQDALAPQDTNGLPDVYEYDADAREVRLLSSGAGDGSAWFEDASANGDDVFFLTSQKLSGRDTDTLIDLYDARVDGGFAEPSPSPAPCEGDACQGVPAAVPLFGTASGFAGLGNKAGRPGVKTTVKKKAKKHTRKKAKRHKKRRAGRKTARRLAVRVSGRTGR